MAEPWRSPFPWKLAIHTVTVDGLEVQLRVFTPKEKAAQSGDGAPRAEPPGKMPAVVMACGLGWLGGGLIGQMGIAFNDGFGRAFARNGAPCVMVHTPARQKGHTRLIEIAALLLWPLVGIPGLAYIVPVLDLLFMAVSRFDIHLLLLFAVPALVRRAGGAAALPLLHLGARLLQRLQRGRWPKHRSQLNEIAEAVRWAQQHQELLCSDGRIVLCGYSSGGHGAALYALTGRAPPDLAAVVLISGIYSVCTHAWTGAKRLLLAPLFDIFYEDALGVGSEPEAREAASPVEMVKRDLRGDWYVLNSKTELLGLQPFQDILFDSSALRAKLKANGATVHRVTCGHNHWLLIASIDEFIQPFCAGIAKT